MRPQVRSGFTLVELLVVIAIIGVLVGLLMPAVGSARESARQSQCLKNVSQLAMACINHESKYGYLPTGGWGSQWAGDPAKGYGGAQPGGWLYNILYFLDAPDLHDMAVTQQSNGQYRMQFPVGVFLCPSRHALKAYPGSGGGYANPSGPTPQTVGVSDYAANGGDTNANSAAGNASVDLSTGTCVSGMNCPGVSLPPTGVLFRGSALRVASIRDGLTYTYLLGEAYLTPLDYLAKSATSAYNIQGWDSGYGLDTIRFTADVSATTVTASMYIPPARDGMYNPANAAASWVYSATIAGFGSPHPLGVNMAFCDGAAKQIRYTIDPEVHRALGNRSDNNRRQDGQRMGTSAPNPPIDLTEIR